MLYGDLPLLLVLKTAAISGVTSKGFALRIDVSDASVAFSIDTDWAIDTDTSTLEVPLTMAICMLFDLFSTIRSGM